MENGKFLSSTNNMNYKHEYLFPTVCSSFDLTNKYDCFSVLESLESSETHTYALWHKGERSVNNNFLDGEQDLKNTISKCLSIHTKEIGIQDLEISISWFTIQSDGGYIKPHRHELSVMSGVFYPYVPNDQDHGSFILESPLSAFKINELHRAGTAYSLQRQQWTVRQGLLIIFPSWMQHYSEGNCSDKRYSISFDTKSKI